MIGGDPNGFLFKDWCWEEWRAKYGVKPVWGKVEYVNLASALARFETEEQARAAWSAYLACGEAFYEGHGPRKFFSSLDRWLVRSRPKPQRRDKMREDGPWAERTRALQRIYQEVNRDAAIPEAMKRDEVSRRFKEIFPVNGG